MFVVYFHKPILYVFLNITENIKYQEVGSLALEHLIVPIVAWNTKWINVDTGIQTLNGGHSEIEWWVLGD